MMHLSKFGHIFKTCTFWLLLIYRQIRRSAFDKSKFSWKICESLVIYEILYIEI